MTKHKRPTPSTLEEWEHFPTINDDTAQTRLARAMGYPPSWRVVRNLIQVPIPEYLAKQMSMGESANDEGLHIMTTVQDRIYAGDPASRPDGYYNHAAALLASSKLPWRPEYDDVIHDNNDDDYDDTEYCSTSHRNKGGQLKGREARFEEGDVVEVLYDEDEDAEPEWYEATVLKKIEYQDDIRYNIHYHEDDALQSNVREEKIRASTKTKKKKKATPKKQAGKKATPKKQGGKKRAAPERNSDDDFETTTPAPKKKRGRPAGSKNKKEKEEEEESPLAVMADPPQNDLSLDEGDPPWRTTGHEHLSRRIQWTPPSEEGGVVSQPYVGTVVAWIAETDVDSEGNPGFECSKTGNPARLFHAIFQEFEQDFEEWELEECFLDSDDEMEDSD
mmetsp:Transcript_36390/g.65515  ORF Transcript_36390/g.65515 Transcript_36390/m.65515 type:complete len:390 (+) Transcript_36390:81-1250(+)|eukprot:CAMPEP_0201910806 /NCGR_PEP_ID=MMETSP0903-20130614/2035_1 /ASSEMBLY_ACC=CAM_ASM_000552 /TAXON_ID=420261 /ORGANISM="Thalassiosira antarctica, Strain CCMP982" /LENGTH=389 /DNA_ID=CAMNT_0048445481 /DNA_START=34 /DNA_END=1203 /DNA_ORIENTATION=-